MPMSMYWKAATSAWRRRPSAISTYDASEEISRKTNRLKASPVTVMPSNPARHRQYIAYIRYCRSASSSAAMLRRA
ncbi:MAG: hypothetical protein U1F45_17690 [Burkholderiales bacterium]